MARSRTYGYIRSSSDPEIEGPEAQERMIRTYCAGAGLGVPAIYVDSEAAGSWHLLDRVAGRRVELDSSRGDHIVVARLDRLAESFYWAVLFLNNWFNRGITVHLLDLPGRRLDAGSLHARQVIESLRSFADSQRRMTGIRTRKALAALGAEGRRRGRWAPYGFKWKKRRDGKSYAVPDLEEQALCIKVAELWDDPDLSVDAIRQMLAYELKVRNRAGREYGCNEVRKMAEQGALMRTARAESQEKTSASLVERPGGFISSAGTPDRGRSSARASPRLG